jgi:hypothetical protein
MSNTSRFEQHVTVGRLDSFGDHRGWRTCRPRNGCANARTSGTVGALAVTARATRPDARRGEPPFGRVQGYTDCSSEKPPCEPEGRPPSRYLLARVTLYEMLTASFWLFSPSARSRQSQATTKGVSRLVLTAWRPDCEGRHPRSRIQKKCRARSPGRTTLARRARMTAVLLNMVAREGIDRTCCTPNY